MIKKSYDIYMELNGVLGLPQKKKKRCKCNPRRWNPLNLLKRQDARKNKDFALADKIRDDLLDKGIVLKDTREGVKWHKRK